MVLRLNIIEPEGFSRKTVGEPIDLIGRHYHVYSLRTGSLWQALIRPRDVGARRSDPMICWPATNGYFTGIFMVILGLHALYCALMAMAYRARYLKYALAAVLVFMGAKSFVADFWLGGDKFPPVLSLGVTFAMISAGVAYLLWKIRGEPGSGGPSETGYNDPPRLRPPTCEQYFSLKRSLV